MTPLSNQNSETSGLEFNGKPQPPNKSLPGATDIDAVRFNSTMEIGPFAGIIYTVILIVDCLFFLILEWSMPREDLDFVQMHWDQERFVEVRLGISWRHSL